MDHSVHAELIEHPRLKCPFHTQPQYHYHPEVELLYVIKGTGKRIISGITENFYAGDLVFLGSNVPHVWLVDRAVAAAPESADNRAILMYVDTSRFETMFHTVNELSSISELLNNAMKGIQITGPTRLIVAEKLEKLLQAKGFERIIQVLEIMHALAVATDKRFILPASSAEPSVKTPDRLNEVVSFIKTHLKSPITLSEAASVAGMSKNAFCRFFRKRMKKSFSDYIREQRIALACSLLEQSNRSISDVAESSGYNSTSHFCQIFKAETNQTPFQYRRGTLRTGGEKQV